MKTYAGLHQVDYFGKFDKKQGTLYGQWELSGETGFWQIQIRQVRENKTSVLRIEEPSFLETHEFQIAV